MKKGFTLVEMLVVIGIIGILAGVMMGVMGGAGDSANAAKCMANLKNLSIAALAQINGSSDPLRKYPTAGSVVVSDYNRKNSQVSMSYTEVPGWIGANSKGSTFPTSSKPNLSSIGAYDDDDIALYAITNGAIWRYMNGNLSAYCCPLHKKKNPKAHWSYFMNGKFGWQADGDTSFSKSGYGLRYGKIPPDRTLLFAEFPFQGPTDGWTPGESDTDADGILQYEISSEYAEDAKKSSQESGIEHIGACHKVGKDYYAHVSFADGHVEKIRARGKNLKELTTMLCEGVAYTLEGGKYVELK